MTERMENRRSGIRAAAEQVFAVLTGMSLLGSLAAMLFWSQSWVTPMWLTLLRCAAAVLGLTLWKRRDVGFCILMVYLALVFLRLLIPSAEKLFDQSVSQTLFNGAWAFLACYSLGHILGYKRTERFLKFFLTGWVFCMTCYSCTGLYAAWTDQRIWNFSGGGFWGLSIVSGEGASRMRMLFDANTSGVLFGSAAVAAFLCAAGTGTKWIKGLHILMFIPNWTALCLTDSRTAQIGAAAGIGTAVGILLMRAVKKRKGKARVAVAASACGALLTAVVCIGVALGTVFAFNAAKAAKGSLLPAAGAESKRAELSIAVWPDEIRADTGKRVKLHAEVQGAEGEVAYQWQYCIGEQWNDLTTVSATTAVFKMTVRDSTYWRKYRCVVNTENGTAVSNEVSILKPFDVTLSVRSAKGAGGDTMTVIAKADGAEGEILYQWQVCESDGSWTDLSGNTRDALTVEVQEEKQYRCVVTAGNGTVISRAKSVGKPSGTSVKTRTLEGGDLLSGRTKIWKQAVRFIVTHPRTLLTGRSVSEPMKNTGIMRTENIVTEHSHNMFLQTLMESGLPGLLLLLAFMVCTGRRAVRLVMNEDRPELVRLMPAAVCAIWVGELTECVVRMTNVRVPMLALLMLYAGIVCAAGKKEKNP